MTSSAVTRTASAVAERRPRDLAVVERVHDAADLLALLVTLAGDHDDVARLAPPRWRVAIAERRSGSTSTSVPAPSRIVLR